MSVIGNKLALDTNAAVRLLNGEGGFKELIVQVDAIFLPLPVIGELRYGALGSVRRRENFDRIARLIESCVVLPIDLGTVTHYAEIRHRLRTMGSPIPGNDVWIAALCLQYGLPLITDDRHFDSIDGLRSVKHGEW